jgi:hypothetical protein
VILYVTAFFFFLTKVYHRKGKVISIVGAYHSAPHPAFLIGSDHHLVFSTMTFFG